MAFGQALLVVLLTHALSPASAEEPSLTTPKSAGVEDRYRDERKRMVQTQLVSRDIVDPRVLEAMGKVPRHEFVGERERSAAYHDGPLPIGERQTISQPYIVAIMTQLARLDEHSRVLEVGTGSGYQAAVLAEVAGEVYSIEIIAELAERAHALLVRLGYTKVHLRLGDGYAGWPEAAPFDAILVTAAPPRIPEPLLEQLAIGGRLVVPVGRWSQELMVYTKTEEGIDRRSIFPVRFVPMTGEIQNRD